MNVNKAITLIMMKYWMQRFVHHVTCSYIFFTAQIPLSMHYLHIYERKMAILWIASQKYSWSRGEVNLNQNNVFTPKECFRRDYYPIRDDYCRLGECAINWAC